MVANPSKSSKIFDFWELGNALHFLKFFEFWDSESKAGEKCISFFFAQKNPSNSSNLGHRKTSFFECYDFLGIRMLRFANTKNFVFE
jgi:hypothetical protein